MDKLHNVEQRQNLPRKKVKRNVEDDVAEDRKKAAMPIRGSGNLGEYLKEERKKGEDGEKKLSTIVDLTAGRSNVYPVSIHPLI